MQAHGGLREEQRLRLRMGRANGLWIGGAGVRQSEMGCLRYFCGTCVCGQHGNMLPGMWGWQRAGMGRRTKLHICKYLL